LGEGREESVFPALKVARQYPRVLLEEIMCMIGINIYGVRKATL
jgi:hypothetical protein